MHVGLLAQWYEPQPEPAALSRVLARSLRDRGLMLRETHVGRAPVARHRPKRRVGCGRRPILAERDQRIP
jgi:hypothetical protein